MPPDVSWAWLVGAAAVWLASFAGRLGLAGLMIVIVIVGAALLSNHRLIAVLVTMAGASAAFGVGANVPVEPGPISLSAVTTSDVVDGSYGPWVLVEGQGGGFLVEVPEDAGPIDRGSNVTVEGAVGGPPGQVGSTEYRAVISATSVELTAPPSGLVGIGNAVRTWIVARLEPFDRGRALLAGFLIGDTTSLDEVDVEAMRLAGLSHFTAVSGSNVALFLLLVYVATGPLSLGPVRRAVVGLLALPLYAAITGFEPSVLRASAMASILLTGRIVGISLDVWQVLAASVAGLILIEPAIGQSAGFQLSVAATAGVMVGARWPAPPGWVARALAVSLGAQIAVAPLLLAYFGKLPVAAPLVNLASAPLVAAATLLGSLGVALIPPLVPLASSIAGIVLSIAHAVAGWPQVSWVGLALIASLALLASRAPAWRGVLAVAGAAAVVTVGLFGGATLASQSVAVLDVGQGDAILVSGGGGHYAIVDTGPDPVVLLDKLRYYRIDSVDLVVLTHLHSDHIGGASALLGRVAIGQIWADPSLHATNESIELFDRIDAMELSVVTPAPSATMILGDLRLTVLGPERRYAESNDQSIVILVQGSSATMLLAGDAEVAEQGDIGPVSADVLKVPHHGGATSDPEWLSAVGARSAVISVGENMFGHPSESVVSLLEAGGTIVLRTDLEGDVIVPLG